MKRQGRVMVTVGCSKKKASLEVAGPAQLCQANLNFFLCLLNAEPFSTAA